jgi:pyruvate-formate lyase-activating enzyme
MSKVNSIGFALDPTNVPSFLLDWEVTKRCNLDCSYCATGVEEGCHDNTTSHPPLAECLHTIDFMYKYVDAYMKYKKPSQRKVVLNVYGGESLFHPNIVEILEACKEKYQQYKDNWYLTITCTTNGVVGKSQWAQIVPLIDVFTLSYHSENLPKQKQQYQDNVLYLKEHAKQFKCVIMMHTNAEYFKDGESMIEFCQEHSIQYVAKPLDNTGPEWTYTEPQFQVLKNFWVSRSSTLNRADYKKTIDAVGNTAQVHSINEGRSCCGGRKLSLNGDLKSFVTFVPKKGFKGWSCSVNWFFLFVQQLTGNVYTNKDCRMSTSGLVEPLGNLRDSDQIINTLHQQLETGTMPIIQCKKEICLCGICAPKAETKEDFMQLITRNVSVDVFQKEC